MIDVRNYLIGKGWEFTEVERARGREAIMNCPLCHDTERKFAINLATGAWQCFHLNRCGEKGSLHRLQQLLGDTPDTCNLERSLQHRKPKPDYQRPKKPETIGLSAAARDYLVGRGFSADTIGAFGLYSPKPDVIAFPYRKNGELVGVKYRSLDKRFWSEKNAEPVLFNRDGVEPPEVVLVEGELNALAWEQYGVRVVSIPNGVSDTRWIENEWDWLEPFTKIGICTDQDAAGESAGRTIAKRLGEWRCWRVRLPHKDAADCLKAKISAARMLEAIEQAEPYDVPALKRPGSFVAEVEAFLLHPTERDGTATGFAGLDRMLKGWRAGEVTVWSGRNGAGKITIISQAMLFLMREHDQRVVVTSLEMCPAHLLAWMVRQAGAEMEAHSIVAQIEKLDGNLFVHDHVGILSPQGIFDIWTYAARRYGVRHFVLDCLMRVELSRSDQYAAQKEFVNQLCSFAQEFGAHVHLVAHPRKGVTDDDTPGKMDVSGSGDITNAAHNVLVLWRPSPEMREKMAKNGMHHDAVLYLRKNRAHGFEGRVRLEFNGNTKRYSEVMT